MIGTSASVSGVLVEREGETVHLEELVLAGLGDVDDPVVRRAVGSWPHRAQVCMLAARPYPSRATGGYAHDVQGSRVGAEARAAHALPRCCVDVWASGRRSRLTASLLTCAVLIVVGIRLFPEWVPPSSFLLLELVAVFLLLLRRRGDPRRVRRRRHLVALVARTRRP